MTNAIIGGALIGCAAVWLMLSIGRIAGISGIVAAGLKQPSQSAWALVFVVGLGIGAYLASAVVAVPVVRDSTAITPLLLFGGLLVGFGTRLGSGCTSGHGVCGMARLSKRSIVATLTFMLVGMVTATLVYGMGVAAT